MATGGGRQLTIFQCCISDSHDVDDDPRTKRVRLLPGTDEDQSSNSGADSEPPKPGVFCESDEPN